MKISFTSLRTKAILAVTLIVGSVLGDTGLTYFAVRQQRAALIDVHAAADTVVGPSIALIRAAKDIQQDVVQVQQFLSDVSATRGQDGLDDGLEEAQKFAAKFIEDASAAAEIAGAIHRPDIAGLLSETKSAFQPYYQTGQRMAAAYIKEGPAGGNRIMPEFDKSSEALQAKMDQLLSIVDVVVGDAAGQLRAKIGWIEAGGDRLVWTTALLGALGIILVAVASVLAIVWVVHPVTRMTGAMRRLADGDLAVTVSDQNRRDEIGAMAAAVLVFRAHMVTEKRLAAEQTEERQRAESEKHGALQGMADKIETDTTAALHDVDARTTAMSTTADDEMTASAVRTGNAAASAAAAATQALANVQTVASAAEELSASIREIGAQVASGRECGSCRS
jgi:methyl-accepting chemotaxis protein